MKRAWAFWLVAGLALPVHAEPLPARLELACMGGGAANKFTSTTVNGWNSSGDTASAQALGSRSVRFQDQVNLWIEGSEGRIRMPRTMLPPIRGGEDGWFKLKSIETSDREITAWCVSPRGGDLSCAMVRGGWAARWARYWKQHRCASPMR